MCRSPLFPVCLRRIVAGLLAVVAIAGVALDSARLRDQLTTRFDATHVELLDGWLATVAEAHGLGETAINMFGGFAVTRRMLAMFRK